MDILKQLNNTVIYIENNLCGEIDTDKIAEIALCPYDKFKRFFSYMTNMSGKRVCPKTQALACGI